jgi:hypothetical protein
MKIFGIELTSKRSTDEEYIEWIRKQVSRSKWYRRRQVFFAVIYFGMFLMTWKMIYMIESLFPDEAGNFDEKGLIGMMIGAFAGLLLFGAIYSVISAGRHFHGLRTERLLLKYHDDLCLRLRSVQQFDPEKTG